MSKKIAVVTGGASGIGKATSLCLGMRGTKVYVTDINDKLGMEVVEAINGHGGEAVYMHLDTSTKAAIEKVFSHIIELEGHIDWLVNNAGIGGKMAPAHEVEEEDWDLMLRINLSGVFFCMQAALKSMIGKGGSIVNVSSQAGLNGMAKGMPYAAAKHGVIGLSKTAALEYGRENIRVNTVCPGFIETPLIDDMPDYIIEFSTKYRVPMRRLGTPLEVANTIYWLLSDESSFINGHSLSVDGGFGAG